VTERRKGFSPPIFFDIRLKRNVRAKGFLEDAFQRLLPRGRYRWFPRLGNANVATGERGKKIADSFSSRILLEEALGYAKKNRRIILFCACEFACDCHRQLVAQLLLRDAERTGHRIKIAEWPGGAPIRTEVRVERAIFEGICGNILNVRLSDRSLPRDLIGLPWGSIVDVISGKESVPIISGPPKFQKGWTLPIWEQHGENTSASELRRASRKWLKSNGIRTVQSLSRPSKQRSSLKVLSVRQPWAHAIIHLGKDVENRTWRGNYTGPLLIHASAYREKNPQRLLKELMANPPPKSKLLNLQNGAIIGVVDLVDYTKGRMGGVRIVEDSKSKWAAKGDWHLHLRNARPIKPVKCKGRLGLWSPSPSVISRLPAWVRKLTVK
jgi:hypothetical protein